MFWFLNYQEKYKGKLDRTTLPEEKATKITFIPLQSLPNFAWAQNLDFPFSKISI